MTSTKVKSSEERCSWHLLRLIFCCAISSPQNPSAAMTNCGDPLLSCLSENTPREGFVSWYRESSCEGFPESWRWSHCRVFHPSTCGCYWRQIVDVNAMQPVHSKCCLCLASELIGHCSRISCHYFELEIIQSIVSCIVSNLHLARGYQMYASTIAKK